jgi:hypothetical protein
VPTLDRSAANRRKLRTAPVAVEARQTHTRSASPLHARHVVRLRRRFETVQLRDSVPEIVFLNSHDGTSAYFMLIFICHHSR